MPKLTVPLLAVSLALSGCVTAPPGASPAMQAEVAAQNKARANLGILALALVAVIVVGVAAGPSEDWGDDGGHHHHGHDGEGW